MEIVQSLNIGSAPELLLIALICFAVTQAIKKYTPVASHYLPWIAMGVGVVSGLLVGISQGDTRYLSLGIMGFLIGGATVGLFDGFVAPTFAKKNDNNITRGE